MPENKEAKNQTKIDSVRISLKTFIIEGFLFGLTLVIGIASALRASEISGVKKTVSSQLSFWGFLFYFLLATALFLFIIKFLRFESGKRIVFRGIFVITVFLGTLLFFEFWVLEPFSLFLTILLLFWWWKYRTVLSQDLLMVLSMAGVGAILGLGLNPQTAILLLIVFSAYDYISVYKTKHMIKMAEEMMNMGTILGIVVPQKISDFNQELKKIEPNGKFIVLGGGDIIFPLLFCSSLVFQGILVSFTVGFFSLLGLFADFYYFSKQKKRHPIPALPLITVFSILGYLFIGLIV